jgi:hypothetical protein
MMWCAVCGVWCVVCGVWCAGCCVWCAVCGVRCVVCSVRCAVCGVQCSVCGVRLPAQLPVTNQNQQRYILLHAMSTRNTNCVVCNPVGNLPPGGARLNMYSGGRRRPNVTFTFQYGCYLRRAEGNLGPSHILHFAFPIAADRAGSSGLCVRSE